MADIVTYVSQYLTFNGLLMAAIGMVISLIVWEIPRFFQILDDDVMKGLYPEYGKILDIAFAAVALISLGFLLLNLRALPLMAHKNGYGLLLAAGLIGVPVIFLLGFFGRIFSRFDAKHEPHGFVAHTILDFVHTIFYICFVGLVLPAAVLLLSS